MLQVLTPAQAGALLREKFHTLHMESETVPLEQALGRVLARPVCAGEDVPGFTRSSVDGYAVRAADTFGCSESIPALPDLMGAVEMGRPAGAPCQPGQCFYVPTGGALPQGADAVVMVEYAEDYGDGTVGLMKPVAPGENVVYQGDDVKVGQLLLPAGRVLRPHHIGALAALGYAQVTAARRPVVGVFSTGDEVVQVTDTPSFGQVRDVNGPMLLAAAAGAGGAGRSYGILPDDRAAITDTLARAAGACDLVLLSGGSSAGVKDVAVDILAGLGEVFFHGLAMKPGKPTIAGRIGTTPVFCLPGHPVAAYFVFQALVRPLLLAMQGSEEPRRTVSAVLEQAIPSNHGRAEYVAVRLKDGLASPVRGKSGLITLLADSQGYLIVPGDCEGLPKGAQVEVWLYDG